MNRSPFQKPGDNIGEDRVTLTGNHNIDKWKLTYEFDTHDSRDVRAAKNDSGLREMLFYSCCQRKRGELLLKCAGEADNLRAMLQNDSETFIDEAAGLIAYCQQVLTQRL